MDFLLSLNDDPTSNWSISAGFSVDHKFYEKLRRWALGVQLCIAIWDGQKLVAKFYFLLKLIECSDPFDKGSITTSDHLGLFSSYH